MDARALLLYQRNPNNNGPNPQRPDLNRGQNNNGNNGGPPRNTGTTLVVRLLILVGIVLLGWYLIQLFAPSSSSSSNPNAIEIPYSTFIQEVQSGNVKDVTFSGQDATGDFYSQQTVVDANGATKAGTTFHFT